MDKEVEKLRKSCQHRREVLAIDLEYLGQNLIDEARLIRSGKRINELGIIQGRGPILDARGASLQTLEDALLQIMSHGKSDGS